MEKKMMKGTLKFGSVAAATAVALALPATATATNGYQLIGVGAYQKGMAGAVTAAPQSAMTAVTNPAGMAAIGTRADFSMEAFMPERHVDFSDTPGGTGEKAESESDLYGVPSIGWTAPTSEGSDLYFGGGMYGTSGMGVDYGQTSMAPANSQMAQHPDVTQGDQVYWDGYSNIQLWEMAPTLAWRMNDQLKLGASLNISYQSVAFQQRAMADTTGNQIADTNVQNFDLSRSASAFGYGLSFGALYEINDELQVGAAYKTKQSFSDLEYQLAAGDIQGIPDGQGGSVTSTGGTYKLGLDLPQQFSLGGAWMPSEDLTVSADIKWINWSDTMDELAVEGDFAGGSEAAMDPGWDDQTVYALGANWGVTPGIEVRAGYNYAESPIDSEDAVANMILPAVVESHYTVGAGFDLAGGWELDAHYMYVPENTVTAPANSGQPDDQNMEQEIGLSETSFGINIGYRF